MPAPRFGQIVMTRQGHSAGKGGFGFRSIKARRDAQHAGSVHHFGALTQITAVFFGRDFQLGGIGIGTVAAPLKARMGVEYHQRQHGADPVPGSCRQRVSVDKLTALQWMGLMSRFPLGPSLRHGLRNGKINSPHLAVRWAQRGTGGHLD